MRVRSYSTDRIEPRYPEDPITVRHARACPDHGSLLDDECHCPHHHTPDRWYVVRIRVRAEPCVVCESAVGLGPHVDLPRRLMSKDERKKAVWIAQVSFKLRRRGWSYADAREEAERRWGLR